MTDSVIDWTTIVTRFPRDGHTGTVPTVRSQDRPRGLTRENVSVRRDPVLKMDTVPKIADSRLGPECRLHLSTDEETDLELQETAGIGALAFSTTELTHGDYGASHPCTCGLVFESCDATARLADADQGLRVSRRVSGVPLDTIGHLTARRGETPGATPGLGKVTQTP